MEFGDITILKNICFSDGVVDHSYKKGRPCIYIGEYLDHMYFVPLANLNSKIKEKPLIIVPTNKNNIIKKSRIKITELVKKPVAFYEIKGSLDSYDIEKLIEALRFFYNEENINSSFVNNLINEYINSSFVNNLINEYINYIDKEKNEIKDITYCKHK